MNLKLHVWRQNGPNDKGAFVTYDATDVNEEMSFLEMLDVINEGWKAKGKNPSLLSPTVEKASAAPVVV